MKKVYLAKSNLVNPTSYITIKGLLERYDCEIIEFEKGPNQESDLFESDILLILTADAIPSFQSEDIRGYFVGRGIFGQIETLLKHELPRPILIANQVMCLQPLQTAVIVDDFKNLKVHDEKDWKLKYGKLSVNKADFQLQQFIPLKGLDHHPIDDEPNHKG